MKKNRQLPILFLSLSFITWRVFLFIVGALASYFLPYRPSFPYADSLLVKYSLPQWLYSWANFDGVHYLTIIEKGYFGTGLIQAFFPFYPILVKLVCLVLPNTLLAGLLVSTICFGAALCIFFQLLQTQFSRQTAWWSVAFLLAFPTSLFAGAVYGEAVFLCAVFLSFYWAQKKQWLWAGLAAACASATRVVGIFLLPALLIELIASTAPELAVSFLSALVRLQLGTAWESLSKLSKMLVTRHIKELLSVLLTLTGLAAYMVYLQITFGDPLYFFHVQSQFGSGREEQFILLPQVLWRASKILWTVPFDLRWWTYFQELFLTILALFICCLGFLKRFKLPIGWLIFSLLAILLPTVTGTLSSMPRYVLVAFPIFVILGKLSAESKLWRIVLIISSCALVVNTILFIQGYWVA